ncbi:hypothetical protein [Sphingomonas alpina]|uniref:Uncharacterized protein n=1 Tax=Sphingomonas alpina TaxID=653931 RepID=A0A7H0LES7_9SPHN|nr:hypothetical protein [Sphingomonas alpina]QNQ08180.1 hypothetical protein H3Z74_15580 [Sphingomonas alpina]
MKRSRYLLSAALVASAALTALQPLLAGAQTAGTPTASLPAANESTPGAAPVNSGCELHVWGAGRPNFKLRPNAFIKITVDPAQMDRSNPLSNASLFDTVSRANALSDDDLKKLLPQAGAVTVVRHAEMIDIDKTPLNRIAGRLVQSPTSCYADLVIGNLYAIFPNPEMAWERAGAIGALLVGSDRLVIEFWLRDFSGPKAGGKTYKRKNDSPLPHVQPLTIEMKTAMEASTTANFRSFVDFVGQQRLR